MPFAERHGHNNDFIKEYFPIPVLKVTEFCDIGVDINAVWVEIKLTKEQAVLLDYSYMTRVYNMEVYGAEDFLNDFYNTQSDLTELTEKIKNSTETKICFTFYFDIEVGIDVLIELLKYIN